MASSSGATPSPRAGSPNGQLQSGILPPGCCRTSTRIRDCRSTTSSSGSAPRPWSCRETAAHLRAVGCGLVRRTLRVGRRSGDRPGPPGVHVARPARRAVRRTGSAPGRGSGSVDGDVRITDHGANRVGRRDPGTPTRRGRGRWTGWLFAQGVTPVQVDWHWERWAPRRWRGAAGPSGAGAGRRKGRGAPGVVGARGHPTEAGCGTAGSPSTPWSSAVSGSGRWTSPGRGRSSSSSTRGPTTSRGCRSAKDERAVTSGWSPRGGGSSA